MSDDDREFSKPDDGGAPGVFSHPAHLVRRFRRAWSAEPLTGADEQFVSYNLRPAEMQLFLSTTMVDRRHSVAVARGVVEALGDEATPEVISAALLHDVGKALAPLAPMGRVAATLLRIVGGRHWVPTGSAIGRYLRYPDIGADALASMGADPIAVAWAREHHLRPKHWTVPRRIANALAEADAA